MAISLRPVKPITDEELLQLSERNPGYQFERSAKGELIVTPTGSEGGRRETRLATQLDTWAQKDGRGVAFGSSTGFRLPDNSVYAPDASWVRRDRWIVLSAEEREGYAPLCPDAVFEVRSKSDTPQDLRAKMRVYLANGAKIGVLIDPYQQIIEIYRHDRAPETHAHPRTIGLDPELPAFVLDLALIFET